MHSRRRQYPLWLKLVSATVALLLTGIVAEIFCSYLYVAGIIEPRSCWILEDSGEGPSIVFDPVRGFRLTEVPSRMACVATNGWIESEGMVRGNNWGFPDRDDFQPLRNDTGQQRFVVFGDSFTSAQFLQQNWPDKVEDLTRAAGAPAQLWNLSLDGGGIVNWWSIATRLLASRSVEMDTLVFAVWTTDLRRTFIILDDRVVRKNEDGKRSIAEGRLPGIDVQNWPTTVTEAEPYFRNVEGWQVLPTNQFERILRQEERVQLTREPQAYLWHRVWGKIRRTLSPPAPVHAKPPSPEVSDGNGFLADRKKMYGDLKSFAEARNLDIIVIHIPSRESLLEGQPPPAEIVEFAEYLDGDFKDGSLAFEGCSDQEIRSCWMRYDGHWNQRGSDRFAEYIAKSLFHTPEPP